MCWLSSFSMVYRSTKIAYFSVVVHRLLDLLQRLCENNYENSDTWFKTNLKYVMTLSGSTSSRRVFGDDTLSTPPILLISPGRIKRNKVILIVKPTLCKPRD